MITRVEIERFSLLSECAVEFAPGLNVITGETGAGKTLILDAIDFCLGARASSRIFPASGGRCKVSVHFELEDGLGAPERLETGSHVIDRIARPGGSGRILLDGEKITAERARALSSALLDYSGQAESREILTPKAQLRFIDAFGDDEHTEALSKFAEARLRHGALLRKLELIDEGEEARKAREALLVAEFEELKKAAVSAGERDTLEESRRKLSNAGRIAERAAAIFAAIDGGESGVNLRARLSSSSDSARALAELLGNDTESGEHWLKLADDLDAMEAGLGEVESSANEALAGAEAKPDELERVQSRLAEIDNLSLKYGCLPDELYDELERREEELGELSSGEFDRGEVAKNLDESTKETHALAVKLTESRRNAAGRLEEQILDYLERLDFSACHFEVAGLGELADEEDSELEPGRRFREAGYDDAIFLVSLNPDEPARPLARVASGGEMSRLMLAITAALASHSATPVLILDEVEAGVGGLTAQSVASVMADTARARQVISVSHLAQVAAASDRHLLVEKETAVQAGGTLISVRALEGDERRKELARMLGTEDVAGAAEVIDEFLQQG